MSLGERSETQPNTPAHQARSKIEKTDYVKARPKLKPKRLNQNQKQQHQHQHQEPTKPKQTKPSIIFFMSGGERKKPNQSQPKAEQSQTKTPAHQARSKIEKTDFVKTRPKAKQSQTQHYYKSCVEPKEKMDHPRYSGEFLIKNLQQKLAGKKCLQSFNTNI